MATAQEHMLADMEKLFARDGEAVVDVDIDGKPYRAIVKDLETDPSKYMGVYTERVSLWFLPSTFSPFPHPGQELRYEGKRWTVEARNTKGLLKQLILGRLTS